MRILMATPYFYPRLGGLESYAQTIALGLVAAGHEVHVVTSGERTATEQWQGLTIHRLRTWLVVSNTPVSPMWSLQIRRLVHLVQPDVVNVHAPVPTMALAAAAAAGRTPIVVTYHAGSMKKGRAGIDTLINLYEQWLLPRMLRRAVAIICASDFVRHDFLKPWQAKSITITPGVDSKRFVPSGQAPAAGRLVFVGDFRDPRKGLDVLLEAIKPLGGVTLRVLGSGKPRQQDGVTFVGVKRGTELVAELQSATALVLPSITEAESFGMVLIEAMACGRAVIGSRIGGVGYVIADGQDGLLVPAGDVPALTTAIASLVHDSALAAKLGQAGLHKATTEYGWDARVAQTAAVLERAASRKTLATAEVHHG